MRDAGMPALTAASTNRSTSRTPSPSAERTCSGITQHMSTAPGASASSASAPAARAPVPAASAPAASPATALRAAATAR